MNGKDKLLAQGQIRLDVLSLGTGGEEREREKLNRFPRLLSFSLSMQGGKKRRRFLCRRLLPRKDVHRSDVNAQFGNESRKKLRTGKRASLCRTTKGGTAMNALLLSRQDIGRVRTAALKVSAMHAYKTVDFFWQSC